MPYLIYYKVKAKSVTIFEGNVEVENLSNHLIEEKRVILEGLGERIRDRQCQIIVKNIMTY